MSIRSPWASGPPPRWEEITRVALTISLMGVALRLPAGYWRANVRWVAASVGVGMLVMFAVSAGSILLLGVPLLSALLVAAAITPTDPVVTTPLVTGPVAEKRIPARVRFNMSSESGLNDGLAFLLVMLPMLLLARPTGEAWAHWGVNVLLWGGCSSRSWADCSSVPPPGASWTERRHAAGP